MLTYPSGSLPQIVCPMDEDAIPPNPFCSAPPHSEPPPPLLPLSSVTPSCANDGIPGRRRSGRIQAFRAQTLKKQSNTDSASVQKPSRQNPPLTKRQREAGSMVQMYQSTQLRAESTHVQVKQNEDGFDCTCTAEHQNNQINQKKRPQKNTKASATENVVEQFAFNTTQNHTDGMKSDMDTSRGLDTLLENASVPKGWVIGPLFQSFKSKMASFTEIVMSPVKLFRANSPPPSMDQPQNLSKCEWQSDFEQSEQRYMFNLGGQSETKILEAEANQQRLCDVGNAQNTEIATYAKKLFDEELPTHSSQKANECGITCEETNGHDSVPLQHSPIPCFVTENVSELAEPAIGSSVLLQTSVDVGSSHETKLKISSAIEDQTDEQAVLLKPLPRIRMGNRSELKKVISNDLASEFEKEQSELETSDSSEISKTVPLPSSDCYTQLDTDCLQPDGDGNEIKMESCHLIQQSLHSHLNNPNGTTTKPSADIKQLEYSAAGLGRAKRGQKLLSHSQAFLKRKQSTANICTYDATKQELINVASQSGLFKWPPNRDAMLMDTVVETEETLKSAIKRKALSTNGKGKMEKPCTLNEAMLQTKTECSPDATLVCHVDKSIDVLENDQRVCSSSKMKPSASCKRLKTRASLVKPDVSVDDRMDLETTVAISSTKQVEEKLLSEVFICPDLTQLQRKCRNTNKKTLKRKSPVQACSVKEADSILDSTSSVQSVEPSELMATDVNISLPLQRENSKTGLNRSSKRPKKNLVVALKSSELSAAQETKQCIKNVSVITEKGQTVEGKSKISTDPVYFEITPFKDIHQPASSCIKRLHNCSVLLNKNLEYFIDKKENSSGHLVDEVFSTNIRASRLGSSAKKINVKPRRADKQRRKCRVLHNITCEGKEVPISVTMEDADLVTAPTHRSENVLSRRLLRSYSCPEIPSFHCNDTPWTASLHSSHHSRTPTSHQHQSSYTPHVPHPYKSVQRARRHTVCSVEVEREIAPLCLRKEVYPSKRSAPYEFVTQHLSPTLALSSSTTLSALASCFLSSPLAFLSKKVDSRDSAAGSNTSSHVYQSSSSSSKSPFSSSTWHLPGFLHGAGSSYAALDSISSTNSLVCEPETRQECEEYGEDTSCSSQEYEDVGLREEKALSDSEIKVVQKLEERGKVSSIRIRKTLPKPQNNLTPMGLPKPIRLKKKEFSLEEIYTNKNFSKPPESRLETIFEVPFNRRNGSESWFGPRRVKRFLEFLEVGEVRKPKKCGVGKTGLSSSRTRRGAFTKDESPLTVQDVDSLLCAKLDELNLWLIHDQNS